MKKANYILLFTLIFTINLAQAQEKKEAKLNPIGYGGIGFGMVENDNEPNYNLNSNIGEILLNYSLHQDYGIATGIGLNQLSGNGFNSLGNFYHERTLIKIPLLFTMNYKLSQNFRALINLGVYGHNIIKDEYRFLTNTQKDFYNGWSFGSQIGVGFLFDMFDNLSAGISYNGQSDFSKLESNKNVGINDKQKIKGLNSIGILLMIKF